MTCRHILVVEDDDGIRETMKELLEVEGYRVSTAENGAEGLQRLEDDSALCLIFLDLMMPVMDGWEFLEAVKKDRASDAANIPVAVVSAVPDPETVEEQYGCTVIRKPVDVSHLVKTAHEMCGPCDCP